MTTVNILILVAMILTLGVLLVGVFAMARGGNFNRKYGNKLMQARVALQFLAILLIGLLFLMAAGD